MRRPVPEALSPAMIIRGWRVRFAPGVTSESARAPEVEIARDSGHLAAVLVLRPGALASAEDAGLARAFAPALACEGVRDIAMTRALVRLSFEPMEHPSCFDEPLGLLVRALDAAPSPYR